MEIKTLKQFNDHYGLWEGMTQEERRERTKQIKRVAEYYGDLDEDTPDFEGYKRDDYEDYKDEAIRTLNAN